MPIPGSIKLEIDAARSAIATVRRLDFQRVSIEEVKEALIPVFRGYVVTAPRFDPRLNLFRARLLDEPEYLHELSYPPSGVASLGRVNREGASVLYCCTAREASFFELAPRVGDTVALAQWGTTAPLLVNRGHDGTAQDHL
jgi:hypothetical protein